MSPGEYARWGYANFLHLSKFCFQRLLFSVTYRAPKLTATSTSELGLDKGILIEFKERFLSG